MTIGQSKPLEKCEKEGRGEGGGEGGRVEGRNDYGGPLCDVHFPRKLSQFRYRQKSQNEMHSTLVLAT